MLVDALASFRIEGDELDTAFNDGANLAGEQRGLLYQFWNSGDAGDWRECSFVCAFPADFDLQSREQVYQFAGAHDALPIRPRCRGR